MKHKILVVDDEPDILDLLSHNLKTANFEVITASSGDQALKIIRSQNPDLVILDVMMPEMDGLEVFRAMQHNPAIKNPPVFFLSAKAAEIDRVIGFEMGADDYITKPFSTRELVIRVKKRLEFPSTKDAEKVIEHRPYNLIINESRYEVTVGKRKLRLTAIEFRLLVAFAKSEGRILTRENVLTTVFRYNRFIDSRTLDTHVRRLRKKLGEARSLIGTVRAVGYRWNTT